MLRKFVGVLAALATVLTSAGSTFAAWPGQYADVDSWPQWALKGERLDNGSYLAWGGDLAEAVWWELMIGDPPADGNESSKRTFRPEDTITRAEYATIVVRALGVPVQQGQGADWYRPAVDALKQRGIISNGGSFTVPITRREMGDWVGRSLNWYGLDLSGKPEVNFSDISGLPEAQFIRLASRAGVIKGYPDGTFGPERTATRAEGAAMAVRLAKQLTKNKPDVKVFEDNFRASWEVVTKTDKETAKGAGYNHGYLMEPYMTRMDLYGYQGYDMFAAWLYSTRQYDSYRELSRVTVEPIILRETIALLHITFDTRRVRFDGTEVDRSASEIYIYYVRWAGSWLEANSKSPGEYQPGFKPEPE